jgi:hypothetical protein
MRTPFPKNQPAHATRYFNQRLGEKALYSAKRVETAVHCAAYGGPHELEIPQSQPLDGVTTNAEREDE